MSLKNKIHRAISLIWTGILSLFYRRKISIVVAEAGEPNKWAEPIRSIVLRMTVTTPNISRRTFITDVAPGVSNNGLEIVSVLRAIETIGQLSLPSTPVFITIPASISHTGKKTILGVVVRN